MFQKTNKKKIKEKVKLESITIISSSNDLILDFCYERPVLHQLLHQFVKHEVRNYDEGQPPREGELQCFQDRRKVRDVHFRVLDQADLEISCC